IRDFHVTGVQTCALPIYNPPSSDGPYNRKFKNKKSKQGGQDNSGGSTLRKVDNPDVIVENKLHGLCQCGASLDTIEIFGTKERQIGRASCRERVESAEVT